MAGVQPAGGHRVCESEAARLTGVPIMQKIEKQYIDRSMSAGGVAMPEDLKKQNRRKIISIFRAGETVTIAEISRLAKISKPTVTRAVQHYCDRGIVRSLGLGSTTSAGGKKPELFRFADERRILCIGLWPQTITLTLSGLIGDVYAVQSFDYENETGLEETFRMLEDIASAYLDREGLTADGLYGVAMSVPGTVDHQTNRLRYNTHATSWGSDVPLEAWLRRIFGDKPVCFIENAGKAAGSAVLLDAAETADKRMLTVFTTWGVSACLMEHGRVINGRDSLIGEIGHMIVSDTASCRCTCGKCGCLESLVNIGRVRDMLRKEGAAGFDGERPASFPALFEASRARDAAAQKVVRDLAHWFAVALHNLSLAYNQEVVIFQGDYARADALFDSCLKRELHQFRYYPDGEPFRIRYDRRDLSLLAARGCAQALKDRYFAEVD